VSDPILKRLNIEPRLDVSHPFGQSDLVQVTAIGIIAGQMQLRGIMYGPDPIDFPDFGTKTELDWLRLAIPHLAEAWANSMAQAGLILDFQQATTAAQLSKLWLDDQEIQYAHSKAPRTKEEAASA
jgi:hypothetical protein